MQIPFQKDNRGWRLIIKSTMLAPATTEYQDIYDRCRILARIGTRGELGDALARQVLHFPQYDLQVIGARMQTEIRKLPPPYREQVAPFFMEQVFGSHHRLLALHHAGGWARMPNPISDRERFEKFCAMVPEGCFCWDERDENCFIRYGPMHRFFYYLMACFTMFVLEEPGHPVGTPFPGSFRVEKKDGTFMCPIRDKEKEVFYSICNFCPAKQSEMPA